MHNTETKIRRQMLRHLDEGMNVPEAILAVGSDVYEQARKAGWGVELADSARAQATRLLWQDAVSALLSQR